MNMKQEAARIFTEHTGVEVMKTTETTPARSRPAVVQLGELIQAGNDLSKAFYGEDMPDWAYKAIEDFNKTLRKIENEVDN